MTSSINEPVAESTPGSSAGCTEPLEVSAAGCVHAASDTGSPEPPTPPATVREFEQALRALGFSNRQAKAIARDGFRPAMPEPEADPESDDLNLLMAALQKRGQAFTQGN
jgi:hypothetical protein